MIANSCFFRSFAKGSSRKALIQITERCNLHCAHCFLSSGDYGENMSVEVIRDVIMPRLTECRVERITLTGGEPFKHPDILEIVNICKESGMRVGICTNATLITFPQIKDLASIGDIHVNVSLDGFSPYSYENFRGAKGIFKTTIKVIRQLGRYKLLQGLLVTPNNFAKSKEYIQLCEFAVKNGAKYVLMNPLSNLGRGVKSKRNIAASDKMMNEIRLKTNCFEDSIQMTYVRFPNSKLPLDSCRAGNVIYVFVRGEVTVCPYLVFATNTLISKHSPSEFIVGNILNDADISGRLNAYILQERYQLGNNETCGNCFLKSECGKGCPAAIISSGQRIEGVDEELCPFKRDGKLL